MSTKNVEKLKKALEQSKEVKAVKNINEHLNCTKQGCFSAWT
ncbi:hypothetical protein [Pendulispora albinea]